MAVTVEEIKKSIVDILLGFDDTIDPESIKEDVPFREQLELDSMDMLDIVLALRQRYRLPIPETDYEHLQTMKSTVEYLLPLLNKAE